MLLQFYMSVYLTINIYPNFKYSHSLGPPKNSCIAPLYQCEVIAVCLKFL